MLSGQIQHEKLSRQLTIVKPVSGLCHYTSLPWHFIIHLRNNRVGTGGEGISVWVNVWHSEIKEEVGEKRPNIFCKKYLEREEHHIRLIQCKNSAYLRKMCLLTIVQLNCGPRSLKYMVAVVPTGRLCNISSSLSDLPSEKDKHTKMSMLVINIQICINKYSVFSALCGFLGSSSFSTCSVYLKAHGDTVTDNTLH